MTREEIERQVDLAWDELVAEDSIRHVGDDKWIVVEPETEEEGK
jgi:hypothetical protein